MIHPKIPYLLCSFFVYLSAFIPFANSEPSVVGDLYVVGDNRSKQLGINDPNYTLSFVEIDRDVISVAKGSGITQLIKSDGSLWALGLNRSGSLGIGNTQITSTSTEVAENATNAWPGSFPAMSFFTNSDGDLLASGSSIFGLWGQEPGTNITTSTPITIHEKVEKIVFRSSHSIILFEDGQLKGAGVRTYFGYYDTYTPTALWDIATNAMDVAIGERYTVYVDAEMKLWGQGYSTNIGFNTTTNERGIANPVLLDTGVSKVFSGEDHLLYLKNGDELWGLGSNEDGQLGLGEELTTTSTPIKIAENVRKVSTSRSSFYIDSSGQLWGMGDNSYGQLGLGDRDRRFTATQITNDVIDVSTDSVSTVILKSNGIALGVGETLDRSIGIEPSPSNDITSDNQPHLIAERVKSAKPSEGRITYVTEGNELWGLGDNYKAILGAPIQDQYVLRPRKIFEDISAIQGPSEEVFLKRSSNGVIQKINSVRDEENEIVEPWIELEPLNSNISKIVEDSYNASAYIAKDNSLWFKGPGDYLATDPDNLYNGGQYDEYIEIQKDVKDAFLNFSAFYLTQDGTLKSYGGAFLNRAREFGNDKTKTGPISIDTEVSSIHHSNGLVLYVKNDGSLWAFGYNNSNALNSNKEYVIDPILIDNDVLQAKSSGGFIIYKKANGKIWGTGRDYQNYARIEDPSTSLLEAPVQLYSELDILDFNIDYYNITLIVEANPDLASSDEIYAHFQQELTLETSQLGEGQSATWYKGEIGDKSTPLDSNGASITIEIGKSSSYWVEYTNHSDELSSDSINILTVEDSYDTWTSYYGLTSSYPQVDSDKDGYIDILEFALNMDPLEPNSNGIQLIHDEETGSNYLEIPINPLLPDSVSIEVKVDESEWTKATSPDIESMIYHKDYWRLKHPVSSMESSVLLRVTVTP